MTTEEMKSMIDGDIIYLENIDMYYLMYNIIRDNKEIIVMADFMCLNDGLKFKNTPTRNGKLFNSYRLLS